MKIVKKGCKNPNAVHAMACCPGSGKLVSAAPPKVEKE